MNPPDAAVFTLPSGEFVITVDNDTSAFSGTERPEYRRMLDDVADGVVDAIIVRRIDRLHRRILDLEELVSLAEHGLLIDSVASGTVDLSKAGGRLIVRLLAAVAHWLNEQGIPGAHGKQWGSQTVLTIIANPRLAGWNMHNGVRVDEVWAVRSLRFSARRRAAVPRGRGQQHVARRVPRR